jgi:hypothetical protein
MKPFFMVSHSVLWYLLSDRPKYLPQHSILKRPSLCFSVNFREQLSHHCRKTDRIIVLYILLLNVIY